MHVQRARPFALVRVAARLDVGPLRDDLAVSRRRPVSETAVREPVRPDQDRLSMLVLQASQAIKREPELLYEEGAPIRTEFGLVPRPPRWPERLHVYEINRLAEECGLAPG